MNKIAVLLLSLLLAACGTQAPRPVVDAGGAEPMQKPAVPASGHFIPPAPTFEKKSGVTLKRGGGFYQDDGPLDNIPVDLASVPDAQPRHEPPHRFANRPYTVLGRDYVPLTPGTPYRREGIASWYGRKFHGQKTSSGEPYDMFGMTAAHPTLPIPSYVRITRPDTGKTVTVRVNDRGPFLHDRVIDLSYTAAWKLGLVDNGSGRVVVESVVPGATPLPEHVPTQIAESKPREEPPTVLRDVEEKGDHYLQLGAFGSRDNAESLRIKLGRELGDLGDKLLVRSGGALHRLQLGPWTDIAEARRIAEQLKSAFDLPSVLVR
jgi:rare lipoprotein A